MSTSSTTVSLLQLLELRSVPWSEYHQQRNRKEPPKIFQNLPVICLRRQRFNRPRIAQTILDQAFPRDPHLLFFIRIPVDNTLELTWFVDDWLCRTLHPLTASPIAANITTRFLSFDPIRTAQTHLRIPGHERSLTQIKFNREGDLLFSCSKDHVINVWFSHNGERLGTYDGHSGAVWTIDVDCMSPTIPPFVLKKSNEPSGPAQSRFLMSGSADNTLRLWSVQAGKCLYKWEFPTAVKSVAFNETDDQVVCITEQRMGYQGAIRVFNINRDGDGTRRLSPN